MTRPLRVEFENAVHHVMARGNERRAVFLDNRGRTRFLETLAEAVERFGLVLHVYCLMPNHWHLVVQTPRGNLSRALAGAVRARQSGATGPAGCVDPEGAAAGVGRCGACACAGGL